MSATSSFYDKNAQQLADQYNSVSFESVHSSWKKYWPESGDTVLDVGAGSGRDARWYIAQGCSVVAVEPSKTLRHIGQKDCSNKLTWIDDSLPTLESVKQLSQLFDLVVLSAIWQHVPVHQRPKAIVNISELLSDKGRLVITLRYGEFDDGRETFGVSVTELEELCLKVGLLVNHVSTDEDSFQRNEIKWKTVVLSKASPAEG
ncbi:class I SAM-dependent methyltransferase [Vibrio sp. HN007]|uniref:class I SAM-dependent methyltransferase n=1 Tax=Vibrio iocasae TaxID=3098914 RepID=UPI0035D4E84E